MSKPKTREELLKWLDDNIYDDRAYKWNDEDKQAHDRIKALIQNPSLFIKGVPKDLVELCKKQQKQIGELIQNQPEVDEEFVAKATHKLIGRQFQDFDMFAKRLKEALQEAGCKIIRKNK